MYNPSGYLGPLATTCCHFRPLAPLADTCSNRRLRSLAPLAPLAATRVAASGCKWLPCTCSRDPLQPAATCGHLRPLAATCGHLRPLAATCGHLQPLRPLATTRVAASGCPALALETPSAHGPLAPLAATCSDGPLRPLAATCGHEWLQVAASGCVFWNSISACFATSVWLCISCQVRIRFAAVALRWRRLSGREAGEAAQKPTLVSHHVKAYPHALNTWISKKDPQHKRKA